MTFGGVVRGCLEDRHIFSFYVIFFTTIIGGVFYASDAYFTSVNVFVHAFV